MPADRTTLAQFLAEERRRRPDARGDLDSVILDVALACTAVAARVALGDLREARPEHGAIANDHFLRTAERNGFLAGMAAEEVARPSGCLRGRYLLVVDPLDGASDIDVNAPVGSIFSILRAPEFLQPGSEQVCAGYALYGPATVLVLTVGRGVHAFTLDPVLGEFVRTREAIRVPRHTGEPAVDASSRRFRGDAVRRGASLVAETHRVLTRGGVFLHPDEGRLRLLHAANPVAFLVEQAGGAAGTGRERTLDVVPTHLHQRVPVIFGAADEVALLDRDHHEHERPPGSPLYGVRGLFRAGAG